MGSPTLLLPGNPLQARSWCYGRPRHRGFLNGRDLVPSLLISTALKVHITYYSLYLSAGSRPSQSPQVNWNPARLRTGHKCLSITTERHKKLCQSESTWWFWALCTVVYSSLAVVAMDGWVMVTWLHALTRVGKPNTLPPIGKPQVPGQFG